MYYAGDTEELLRYWLFIAWFFIIHQSTCS